MKRNIREPNIVNSRKLKAVGATYLTGVEVSTWKAEGSLSSIHLATLKPSAKNDRPPGSFPVSL